MLGSQKQCWSTEEPIRGMQQYRKFPRNKKALSIDGMHAI